MGISIDSVWPKSHRWFTKKFLSELDPLDYGLLKRRLVRREYLYTGNIRRAKEIGRRLEKKRNGINGPFLSKRVLNARFQPCLIMDSIYPRRPIEWKRAVSRSKKACEIDVKDFSFIDNSNKTFDVLCEIIRASCVKSNVRLNFRDEYVLDVGPYLVLGVMMERTGPFVTGGLVSRGVRKILEVVRLREFLGMKQFKRVGMDDIWPLPLHQRRKTGSSRSRDIAFEPATFETTADRIVFAVNGWLRHKSPPEELTRHGAGRLKAMIGEILNNAERHGHVGGDGEWIAAGFMMRRKQKDAGGDERPVHVCHLAFFNPGKPIGETILTGPAAVTEQIGRYLAQHKNTPLSQQTLATVFALQDGISRVAQADGSPTGGTGMMDLMEFANEVGQAVDGELDTKVVILSGRSCVRCENDYKRGRRVTDKRRILWFNSPNVPTMPPDNNYVKDLPVFFPGTLISLRFTLDGAFADNVGKADEQNVDKPSQTNG